MNKNINNTLQNDAIARLSPLHGFGFSNSWAVHSTISLYAYKASLSDPKHEKVTTEHIRTLSAWSLEKAYSETLAIIFNQLGTIGFYNFDFDPTDLKDLNYHWSYEIPFDGINNSFVDQRNVLAPADYQEEFVKFTSEKFHFTVCNVASRLGIPVINLSRSYDPSDWETVVHAMIKESTLAFRINCFSSLHWIPWHN